MRQASRELKAASRMQRERQERERIEQAATPVIKPKEIKARIGSPRKARRAGLNSARLTSIVEGIGDRRSSNSHIRNV